MAASAYPSQAQQPFRASMTTQSAYPHGIPSNCDRDGAMTGGLRSPYSTSPVSFALLRGLPANTSDDTLRAMMVFSTDLIDAQVLSVDQSDDAGSRTALLRFQSPAGAQEAKRILDGKSQSANDPKMIVEIGSIGQGSWMFALDTNQPAVPPAKPSSATSSSTSSLHHPRFDAAYRPLERVSPPMNGLYNGGELPNPEHNQYHSMFTSQSPIGNHLTEARPRMSGKTLINNDGPDDDETGELLKDPVAYADAQQRRANAPRGNISQMFNGLSLNGSTAPGPPPMTSYTGHANMPPVAAPHAMSPTAPIGSGAPFNNGFRGHNFPPVNPADQNPPCNTLYVGNLPIDTAEEELKALFAKARGYKRLCFRTKQNGPMCFVEFEDVTFATKALHDLYGICLHNSVKGGIRLSFSKNPLGVRSGQAPSHTASGAMPGMNGMMPGSANGGFSAANGPPPGLGAPPGLNSHRFAYSGNPNVAPGGGGAYAAAGFSNAPGGGWNKHNGARNNVPASMMTGGASAFSPHMMGR